MYEGVKDEVEALQRKLQGVRADLAPWEAKIQEASAAIKTAAAERDLLRKKSEDAKQRFRV